MTCIVGLVRDGEVYLGADSLACTEGWRAYTKTENKIFKVGECVIGLAGSVRALQLLKYKLTLPPMIEGETDMLRWMVTGFVESVRACWRNGGILAKEKEIESAEHSYFLVGLRGRLFVIFSDLQVSEDTCGYGAIGSGGDFALGSLYRSVNLGEDVKTSILAALAASEEFNIGVRGPFHIISTKEGYNG